MRETDRERRSERKFVRIVGIGICQVFWFSFQAPGCAWYRDRRREREIERIRERKKNKTTQFNLKLYRKL